MDIDELKIFRNAVTGKTHKINKYIDIRSPTLGEICDIGEKEYYSTVSMLCATPSDFKVQLWDCGVNWEEIDDWSLFTQLYHSFQIENTKILLGDLDLSKLNLAHNTQTNEIVIVNETEENGIEIVLDRVIYWSMVNYIRSMHGFEHRLDKASNKITRRYMIEDERRTLERQKDKPKKSMLKPLIASMINQSGFDYNYDTVWDLSITAFSESVSRIQKYLSYVHTMQGIYSGCIASKDIDFEEINWIG